MMKRLMRMVEPADWCLSGALLKRRDRLLDVPRPEELLEHAIAQAGEASRCGRIKPAWEPADERPGYFRLVAQIPLNETTFDQIFNGRSGYRAQYYLSPEEGILYNRDILHGLGPALETACTNQPLSVDSEDIEKSLQAPHSKIWVFEEKAFGDAVPYALNPPRWVDNCAECGRRAPLPSHCMIEVKGAFIRPGTSGLFVDDLKLDRACRLFNYGFT